jgi:ABC-type antimicrobial peptide transport system permease subunit
MRLVLGGVALGLAGAAGTARGLARILSGVSPGDPATFAGVTLTLVAVAVVAIVLPARQATRVDPAVALRAE